MTRDDHRPDAPAAVKDIDVAVDLRRQLGRALEKAEGSGDAQLAHDLQGALQSEERLVAELRHRVRNILAMLRSVISRTAVNKTDVQEYVDHLQARIDAIARTQMMFMRAPGRSIELEDIIRDELVAQAAEGEKYRLEGPALALAPKSAEVLALAIHELATNSVKYGALGDRRGSIVIDWSAAIEDGKRSVHLNWREAGLDLSNLHPLGGFGTELITKRIPYELGGRGTLDFKRRGLLATICFPLEDGSTILQFPERLG